MSKVFVLDTMYRPLDPIHPGYARKLLSSGKAAVFRRYPFTIILKKEVQEPVTHPLRVKLDPGSKTTGLLWSMMHLVRWCGRRNSPIEDRQSKQPLTPVGR